MSEEQSENTQDNTVWNTLFIFGVLLFIGVVGYFVGMDAISDHRRQIHAFETYQPAPATVLKSRVKSSTTRRTSGTGSRTSYRPSIRYQYSVDGKEYKSWTYNYFRGYTSKSEAQSIVDRHPVGAEITAYYDPSDPDNSVLDKEKPDDAWIVLAFFIGFWGIFLGIATLVVSQLLKDRHAKERR